MAGRVAVVGAGMAGVTAARRLAAAGHDVVVFDKSPRVGGRMATRRVELADGAVATFDHGCQHLSADGPEFAGLLAELTALGVTRPWAETLPGLAGGPFWYAPLGMRSVVEHLARTLTVRPAERVLWVERLGPGWRVWPAGRPAEPFEAVVLTPPVPQAVDLLGDQPAARAARDRLAAVSYTRSLTLMAVLDPAAGGALTPPAAAADRPPVVWVADNRTKGVSAVGPAVTAHSADAFARLHWFTPNPVRVRRLWAAAGLGGGGPAGHAAVHRWKFARPLATHPDRCAAFPEFRLAVAGDGFGTPGGTAEAAYLSGLAAADAVGRMLA